MAEGDKQDSGHPRPMFIAPAYPAHPDPHFSNAVEIFGQLASPASDGRLGSRRVSPEHLAERKLLWLLPPK